MSILISGYFGFGNAGDEAILAGMVEGFRSRRPDLPLEVLSAEPETTRKHYGVQAIPRSAPLEVWRAIRRSRLFLSGGGGLLQNATSTRSLLYYAGLLGLAQRAGKRTMIFAQGIGPLNGALPEYLVRSVARNADAITVRDPRSAEALESVGVRAGRIRVTADAAFLMSPGPREVGQSLLDRAGAPKELPKIAICLRKWAPRGVPSDKVMPSIIKQVAGAVRELVQRTGMFPVAVPLAYPQDHKVADAFCAALNLPAGCLENRPHTPQEPLAIIGEARVVLGMRLHALIMGAMAEVPFCGLSYDPKVEAFAKEVDMPVLPLVASSGGQLTVPAADAMAQACLQCLGDNSAQQRLSAWLPQAKARAGENIDVALELLG